MDALLKDGKVVTKKVKLDAFNTIEIETSVRLVLTNDTSSVVTIEGLDFIIPRLVLSQHGTVLSIESDGLIGFREKQMPSLKVSAKNLTRITSNFPAKITNTDTLSFENLRVVVNGTGTFTECNMIINAGKISLAAYGSNVGNHIFKGKADNLDIVTEGLSAVDASELAAQNVSVVQKSVNSSEVNAVSKLSVNMLSSGNVFYSGNPEISVTEGKPLYDVDLGNVLHLPE
jgi:hypothetical protein